MKEKSEAKNGMQKIQEKVARSLENVEHTIAVISGKGGVGKSTVAANLATELSMRDFEAGLLDCDMHGPSIPKIVGVQGDAPEGDQSSLDPMTTDFGLKVMSIAPILPEEDSPVIWRGPLKMKTLQQFLGDVAWGNLDYLIFDLPPGTGDEPLTIAQLIPDPDGVIIVTTPQEVALQTIRRAVNFAEKVELPIIGLIENMSGLVCPHCGEEIDLFGSGGGENLSEELNITFLGKIPLDPEVVESGEEGEPFVLDEDSKSSKPFSKIADKVEDYMRKSPGGENE